jgi:hypothetical protein
MSKQNTLSGEIISTFVTKILEADESNPIKLQIIKEKLSLNEYKINYITIANKLLKTIITCEEEAIT